jgi:hypothetical protein
MKWDAVLLLLLGSGLTLLAQWSSLAYQTRRQQEARRADFQRTTLLQLRDLLGEVDEAVRRAMDARRRLSREFERDNRDPDEWESFLSTSHPDKEALHSLTYRLELLGAGVEHEPLRSEIGAIALWATLGPLEPSDQKAEDTRWKLLSALGKAVELLGEQLRRLHDRDRGGENRDTPAGHIIGDIE